MKRRAKMLDETWLKEQYINLGKTRKEIANETGLTLGRVGNLLQEYGIVRKPRIRHGLCTHPLNIMWQGMKERCYNPNAVNYQWYGGKGIKLCNDWLLFTSFYNWAILNEWHEGLTIDRIDSNANYSPENCRFITHKEQCRNRKSNVHITVDNETHIQCVWEELLGLKSKVIAKWKYKYGMEYVVNKLREERMIYGYKNNY